MSLQLRHWTARLCPSIPLRDPEVTSSSPGYENSEAVRYLGSGSNFMGVRGPYPPQSVMVQSKSLCDGLQVYNPKFRAWMLKVTSKPENSKSVPSVKQDKTRLRVVNPRPPTFLQNLCGCSHLLHVLTGSFVSAT